MDPAERQGKGKNIPAGTLIQEKVVQARYWDFYMCSHYGVQGTSKAAHYYVLHDENGFDMTNLPRWV